jgi:DNA-binding NtrC family response regulator
MTYIYKILWVEDDASLLWDMMEPLLTYGVQIDVANNFESAKEKICDNNYKFDLIILDLIIPSGKPRYTSAEDIVQLEFTIYGLELLKFINSKDKTPVVIFSVVSDREIIEEIMSFDFVKAIFTKGQVRPSEMAKCIMGCLKKD